jgi:thiol:disulfide interchange protein DsbA
MKLIRNITLLLGLAFLMVGNARAETPDPLPYDLVMPPQLTPDKTKIHVVELFWYTCPHCYGFEPHMQKWLETKPADVEFERMPAVYSSGRWNEFAKAYYTAKVLDVLDKIHTPLFRAVHDEKKQFATEKDFAKFFAEVAGVKEEEFLKTYNSFAVDTMMRNAAQYTTKHGVQSVPTIIVNGKYRLPNAATNGYVNMMQAVDQLIVEERKKLSVTAAADKPAETAPAPR